MHASPLLLLACCTVLALLALTPGASAAETKADAPAERCFEMRTYTANPGKLAALHTRFREHTNALFVKHGMDLVGYWTPTDAETAADTLIYILAYPSREAREASWKAFSADPAWITAKAASEVDGPLVSKVVSVFMKPTDYSPLR